jgi:hypothetical protein
MEPAKEASGSLAPPPVFVDDTGRRRVLTRRAVRILVVGFTAYVGLLVVGFARDPRVGPLHLPTFGLPGLGLVPARAPSVLGEEATRNASDAGVTTVDAATGPADRAVTSPGGHSAGTAAPGHLTTVGAPAAGAGSSPSPTGNPAAPVTTTTASAPATTTTSTNPGHGPKSTTTTTTTSSTSTTSTTTSPTGNGQGSGQGSEQGTGPVQAKGPDGTGAPGQERRPTTTTTG